MSTFELEYWRAVLILDLLASELLTDEVLVRLGERVK
jgi:hypothetical protein